MGGGEGESKKYAWERNRVAFGNKKLFLVSEVKANLENGSTNHKSKGLSSYHYSTRYTEAEKVLVSSISRESKSLFFGKIEGWLYLGLKQYVK